MIDRANRLLWLLLALLVLAASVGGLVASFGGLPGVPPSTPVLPGALVTAWERLGGWGPALVALAGIALAAVGWWLARVELRRAGRAAVRELPLPRKGAALGGRTVVRGPALAHRIEDDLARVPGVTRALVALVGSPAAPQLRAQLDVAAAADLAGVREAVSRRLDRLTATLGTAPSAVDVTFRLVETAARRVR